MTQFPEIYRYIAAGLVGILAFWIVMTVFNRMTKPSVPPVSGFSLADTISDIKAELARLENTPGPRLDLELSEVKIELNVQEDKTQSGNVDLTVPVFDDSALKTSESLAVTSASKITITLVPPRGQGLLGTDRQSLIRFAGLLVAARATLREAMLNEPRLDAKSIDLVLNFVLVRSNKQSAAVEAKLLSAGIGRETKKTDGNTVTLKYVNPAYQPKDKPGPTPP